MRTKEDFEKLENDEIELINNEHLKRAIETIFTQNRSRECVRRNKQPGYEKMRVEGAEIKCPICGGQLQYWKEYLSQKTQMITFGGEISKKVITTKPEAMDDMQGFECVFCGWIFNTANDIEKCEKYPHLIRWEESHADELRV